MFGVMKPDGCSKHGSDGYSQHRLHYCGTCKTMGQEYGQKTRMLLNFDAVFLSELLTELSNDQTENWDLAYSQKSCMDLPDEYPESLLYSASANVLLAALKTDDNVRDSKSLLWKGLRWFYKKSYKKSLAKMKQWGVDTDKIWFWIEEQQRREAHIDSIPQSERLNYVAEPTAMITAEIFGAAAKVIEKPEEEANLRKFGEAFGVLAYLIDAMKDRVEDLVKGDFNAFFAHFGHHDLSEEEEKEAYDIIAQYQQNNIACIDAFNISVERKEQYKSRLLSGTTLNLYSATPEVVAEPKEKRSFKDTMRELRLGIKERIDYARNTLKSYFEKAKGPFARAQYAVLFSWIVVLPDAPDYIEASEASANSSGTSMMNWLVAGLAALGLVSAGACHRQIKKGKPKRRFRRWLTKGLLKRWIRRKTKNRRGCEGDECDSDSWDAEDFGVICGGPLEILFCSCDWCWETVFGYDSCCYVPGSFCSYESGECVGTPGPWCGGGGCYGVDEPMFDDCGVCSKYAP